MTFSRYAQGQKIGKPNLGARKPKGLDSY